MGGPTYLSEEPHHNINYSRQEVCGDTNLPCHINPGILFVQRAHCSLGAAGMGEIDAIEDPKDEGEPARRVKAIGLGGKGALVLARHADCHPRVVHVPDKQHDTGRWDDAAVKNLLQVLVGRV